MVLNGCVCVCVCFLICPLEGALISFCFLLLKIDGYLGEDNTAKVQKSLERLAGKMVSLGSPQVLNYKDGYTVYFYSLGNFTFCKMDNFFFLL